MLASGGVDGRIPTSRSYTLGLMRRNLRLPATGATSGAGSGLNNVLMAGAGINVLLVD